MSVDESVAPTSRPIVAPRLRPAAYAVIAACLGLLLALSVWLHGTSDPTGLEHTVAQWLYAHTGTAAQETLLSLSYPALTIGLVVLVAFFAAMRREWEVLALAALAPALAVITSSVILKPIVGRKFGVIAQLSNGAVAPGFAFPSGHETALVSTITLLSLLLLRAPVTGPTKAAGLGLAVLWAVAGAAGLVRSAYHYGLDTVGGACVAVAVVLGAALTIDALAPRFAARRLPAASGPVS